MSLQRFLSTNAVAIYKPGSDTTRYRNKTADWNFIRSITPTTGWLVQVSTSEQVGAREVVTSGWKLYLSQDEDIAAQDRVVVDDSPTKIYEVDGDPVLAQTPRGGHHIECLLKRVTDWQPA